MSSMLKKINVLIVDDHPVVRQGIRSLLAQYPDIHVVGEGEDANQALELVNSLRPDVVLLDIRMPDLDGIQVARRLSRSQPNSRVVILTSYDEDAYLLQAAQANVYGYLLKSASPEMLAETIRCVHAGQRKLSSTMADKVLPQLGALARSQARLRSGLSESDIELLRLIADGAAVEDIARQMNYSDRTVKRKIQEIITTLGATNRSQAISKAFHLGLL